MKHIYKIFVLVLLIAFSANGLAATIWVGSSTACTGSNVFTNLPLALFEAGVNGQAVDEIRLTNKATYTGNTNGQHTLTDWDSGGSGVLTIVGGYPDCFTSASGRTKVGDSAGSSFTVNTNNQSNSIITLKNLELSGNASRGLVVRGGGIVTLDNVSVDSNTFSGVDIGDGGFVEILANSSVTYNYNNNNPIGGGVRCTGTNSAAVIHGYIAMNGAQKGANLYVSTGCSVELKDGMRIVGIGIVNGSGAAIEGGGAYIDNGGSLFADGRANRVIFDNNSAERGGALYINGSGFALLQNTHMNASEATSGVGAAIYANGGGTASQQLIMGQTTACNLLFRCSEIQGSRHSQSVIEVVSSFIELQRTVIEQSEYRASPVQASGLIHANLSKVRLNRVGLLRNEGYAMLGSNQSLIEATHVTMSTNETFDGLDSKSVYLLDGSISIQNSLMVDTSGADIRGVQTEFVGACNLVDNSSSWPPAIYHVGVAQLINAAAGDARQIASSPGVDMCERDFFTWSSEIDIENQAAPVNESTNPQGLPGDAAGLYDAGFDEVYDNIGEDEFVLSITKEGTGSGSVISIPNGIACGDDCSETYFKGTIVTLHTIPDNGSTFLTWYNCPLVNQDNACQTQVNNNHTIRAEFSSPSTDNLIFNDGFE